MDPYLRPLYDALYQIMGAESFKRNMENGLIEDRLTFLIQERLSEYHNEWKAGTYTLSTEMTTDEILAAISPKEETEDGTE